MVPAIRYESNKINFTDNVNTPSFPINSGETYHSYTSNKPDFSYTSRLHGTTETSWKSENLKKDFRDTIYTFWDTTLQNGYNQCTAIDHKGRMLFDTYWYRWVENWKAMRGGVFDINYNFASPVGWTLPTLGAYTFVDNTVNSHNLRSESNLTLSSGSLITNSFRTNGYVLNCPTGGGTAASTTNTVQNQMEDCSFSFFAQTTATGGNFTIASIENTIIGSELALAVNGSNQVYGYLSDGSSTDSTTGITLIDATWVDVAFCYNDQTKKCYVYLWEAGDTDYTDFLHNNAIITEAYIDDSTSLDFSTTNYWNRISLGVNSSITTAMLANVFIFEGVLSSMEFNTLRRLCHNWNKSTGLNPK